MVYHYTTIDTLFSILASYKASEDKDYFTFWASNALDQNDTEELSLSIDDLRDVILEVEKEKEEKIRALPTVKLSQALYWVPIGKSLNMATDKLENFLKESPNTPFTLSFSRNKDSLLMWSMYANNGNGICLVFNLESLSSLQTNFLVISNKVIYDKEKTKYIEIVRLIYDDYLKQFEHDTTFCRDKIFNEGCHTYKTLLRLITPFVKNKAFEPEQEWRIIFYGKNLNDLVYQRITGNMNIVHYIKVGIPISAIEKIIIGPCADYDRVMNLLLKEAKNCAIEKMSNSDFYVKSAVPFRVY